MKIGEFSIKNPVLINIAIITILLMGYLSLNRLPREQFAEVPFYWVNIITPFPGVSAEDIEKSMTIPIENEMNSLDSVKTIQSISSEGLSVVRVEFIDGINGDEFERLFQDVRTRYSKVELPEGSFPGLVDDFSSSDFLPVIEVVLSGNISYENMARQAQIITNRLKGISEVSGVDIVGLRDRQIVIEADRTKLNSLGISISEIIRAVSLQNLNIPGGTLETRSREYLLRAVGELNSIKDFNDIIIRRGADSSAIVKVGDISTVTDRYDPKGIISRFNGETALVLRVSKVPGGNSIGVIEDIKEELNLLGDILPEALNITLSGDSTIQIRDSINVLLNNALFGLLLLVVILFIFIGLRNALITALGIPVTFAMTFLILEYFNETFNTNTLFGMVLVLGLIVDHAIVITENSFRLQSLGLSRRDAAIKGVNQVVIPVIAATATTVAAFLPLMLLPGTIGKFLRVIPFTVSIALIASTFEAIIFIPTHYADWPHKRDESIVFKRFNRFQHWFKKKISNLYTRKKMILPLLFILLIGIFSLLPLLKQDLFSAEDFTLFYIDIEMAPGTPISKTDSITTEFENRLLPLVGNGEIVSVTTSVGFISESSGNSNRSNISQIVVDLEEVKDGRSRSITTIMADIEELMADIPGTESVQFKKATNGPPTSKPVSFRLFGENYNNLIEVSNSIIERLNNYPELYNIEDNLEVGSPEIKVLLNSDRAAALGIDVFTLGSYIRDSFEGSEATTFFKNNEEIEVIVKYDNSSITTINDLDQLLITLQDGRQIPFSSIATLVQGNALASIKRVDGKREITVESDALFNDNVQSINKDIRDLFKDEFQNRYPEIELIVGGEFAELGDLLFQILRVFLIGIFLIYLILGAQFRSYIQPFLIILTIPFAFAGVILYLFITGTPFSTTVLYSGVALAGIAVNDSIVLISFINEQRLDGVTVKEAIITAAETRLRPILLTSLTTIAGLLPTATGIGGKSVVWSPMAGSIIFGLLFSTITALVIIPLVYGLLFDKEKR